MAAVRFQFENEPHAQRVNIIEREINEQLSSNITFRNDNWTVYATKRNNGNITFNNPIPENVSNDMMARILQVITDVLKRY
jgi:hypothetical protein